MVGRGLGEGMWGRRRGRRRRVRGEGGRRGGGMVCGLLVEGVDYVV